MSAFSSMLERTKNVGLFGISMVLNGVVSLVSIPVIVAVVGAGSWASMATGQSIGGSIAVLTIFGWGLTGPVSIAMAAVGSRPRMFLDSLFARGVLVVPLLAIQAAITFAIVPQEKLTAFVAGSAMTLAGMSANWYFTGEGRADRFLLFDTVPRISGTIAGVIALAGTGDLLLFAAGQLLGSVAALVVSCGVIFRQQALDVRAAAGWRRIRGNLIEQRHGVVATGLMAAYLPTALAIIAVMSPALLPMFVLAERVGRFVAMAISPLLQMFQGWVPAASGLELVRRMRVAGRVMLGTAIVAGLLYTIFLPGFSDLLTHGEVTFTLAATIAFGINMTTAVLSPYLTNVGLMALGRLRTIALSVAVGVVVTLVALLTVEALAPDHAVWALVTGNLLVTAWQTLALRKTLRATQQLHALTPHLTPNNPETFTAGTGVATRSRSLA